MFAMLRLMAIGFVILTVIYIVLSLWSRSVRRAKLAEWWEEEGKPGDLDSYIDKGLEEYDSYLRRKLILAVYVIPYTLMCIVIYLSNFS